MKPAFKKGLFAGMTLGMAFIALLIIAVVVIAVVFWPAALIWALNVLFGLSIPFTFKTWLAAWIITSLFALSRSS